MDPCQEVWIQRLRDEQAVIDDRVAQAQSAYRYLSQLSGPVREALITHLYELRSIDVHTQPPKGEKGHNNNGKGKHLHLFGMVLVCMVCSGMFACGELPAPHNLLVACDGTGESQANVCTTERLEEAFADWSSEHGVIPGASYQVITSAGSFSETQVHDAVVVPDQWNGDSRTARISWMREGLDVVGATPIPMDTPATRRVNQSDLLSLVMVASRRAEESPEATVELLLASDGWLISYGFDARHQVPTAEQVLARLEATGAVWDLSSFSSVTFCGFHNHGTTAAKTEARERLWRELMAAGGGPEPTIRTSCKVLYPSVPLQLARPGTPSAVRDIEEEK